MIEEHLTSKKLSKRLKELGVPQKSEYYYWRTAGDEDRPFEIQTAYEVKMLRTMRVVQETYSAFLSSELGEILPDEIEVNEVSYWLLIQRGFNDGWQIGYRKNGGHSLHFVKESETLAESMGLMLEYLITNGIIKL